MRNLGTLVTTQNILLITLFAASVNNLANAFLSKVMPSSGHFADSAGFGIL